LVVAKTSFEIESLTIGMFTMQRKIAGD